MRRLIVYAGANGAGKSSLRDIGDDHVDQVIDPDRIAREISPATRGKMQVEAGRAAIHVFRRCLMEGKSMSIETTLSGSTILHRIAEAKSAGYEVFLRFIGLETPTLHIARVEERVRNGGHAISRDTILRRFASSLKNLPLAVDLADHVIILDNSAREPRTLLHVVNGTMLELNADPPTWFTRRWSEIRMALFRKQIQRLPEEP